MYKIVVLENFGKVAGSRLVTVIKETLPAPLLLLLDFSEATLQCNFCRKIAEKNLKNKVYVKAI